MCHFYPIFVYVGDYHCDFGDRKCSYFGFMSFTSSECWCTLKHYVLESEQFNFTTYRSTQFLYQPIPKNNDSKNGRIISFTMTSVGYFYL